VICRGGSTSVERGSWPLRHKGRKRRTDRGFGIAKIKMQSAKLRNPGLVGMGVLVVGSFSISRILYLLDVYCTSCGVGCQVNFLATKAPRHEENHRFEDWTGIHADFHGK